jgi:non-specific protein-tyrosine kinase
MVVDDKALTAPPLQETEVSGLWLLSSGPLPPNPSELLGSRRMKEIIDVLSQRADIVLFDAPPIIAVTDAAVLSSKVDGVLLVIDAGGTKRDHAQRAKALLEKVNAHLVGAVLNNVKMDTSLHQYYAGQKGT